MEPSTPLPNCQFAWCLPSFPIMKLDPATFLLNLHRLHLPEMKQLLTLKKEMNRYDIDAGHNMFVHWLMRDLCLSFLGGNRANQINH